MSEAGAHLRARLLEGLDKLQDAGVLQLTELRDIPATRACVHVRVLTLCLSCRKDETQTVHLPKNLTSGRLRARPPMSAVSHACSLEAASPTPTR